MKNTLFLSLGVLLVGACANVPPAVPAALEPGVGESMSMIVAARGVQIYQCRTGKGGTEWAFVAPDAQLFDRHGRLIGEHGAGPHWQARDGSRVLGTVKARADAPAAGAIPWLLLATKSGGPQGLFSRVTSIQRVNTAGGVAPATGCDAETTGATARVDYTADYILFTPR
jgi:hypothetical protein